MNELNMISKSHNYDNGYIALVNLPLPTLPPKLTVGEYELLLKSEFHISLVCAKKVAALINPDKVAEIEAEIVDTFTNFIKATPLTDYELTNEFRLVKRDARVTLVVLAKVPHIEDFFAELEKRYSVAIPVQVTHITLYTLQPEAGIGLVSTADLERDSVVVNVPLRLH